MAGAQSMRAASWMPAWHAPPPRRTKYAASSSDSHRRPPSPWRSPEPDPSLAQARTLERMYTVERERADDLQAQLERSRSRVSTLEAQCSTLEEQRSTLEERCSASQVRPPLLPLPHARRTNSSSHWASGSAQWDETIERRPRNTQTGRAPLAAPRVRDPNAPPPRRRRRSGWCSSPAAFATRSRNETHTACTFNAEWTTRWCGGEPPLREGRALCQSHSQPPPPCCSPPRTSTLPRPRQCSPPPPPHSPPFLLRSCSLAPAVTRWDRQRGRDTASARAATCPADECRRSVLFFWSVEYHAPVWVAGLRSLLWSEFKQCVSYK